MEVRQSAGGVIMNGRNEVVVVSQRGDSWSLPKGHVDPGEDLEETARREIKEETGIVDLTLVRPLGSYQRCRIGKGGAGEDCSEMKEIHMFLYNTKAEALVPEDPDNPEARWVDKDMVADMLSHPKDAEFFRSIVSEL